MEYVFQIHQVKKKTLLNQVVNLAPFSCYLFIYLFVHFNPHWRVRLLIFTRERSIDWLLPICARGLNLQPKYMPIQGI